MPTRSSHALTRPGAAGPSRFATARRAVFRRRRQPRSRAAPAATCSPIRRSSTTLEAVLHPLIRVETARQVAALRRRPYVLLMVPLLLERGRAVRERATACWSSIAGRTTQVARVVARSGLDPEQVRAIIARADPARPAARAGRRRDRQRGRAGADASGADRAARPALPRAGRDAIARTRYSLAPTLCRTIAGFAFAPCVPPRQVRSHRSLRRDDGLAHRMA